MNVQSVKSTVYYLGNRVGDRPYWGAPATGKGCNIVDIGEETTITDVRTLPAAVTKDFDLDLAGFKLIKHESIEKAFANNDKDELEH